MKYINTLIYSNRPGTRIFRHVLYWVTDIVNWFMVISLNDQIGSKEISVFLLTLPLVIGVTYFIIYYVIPKFSNDYNKAKLFLWIGFSLVGLGVALRFYKVFILYPAFDINVASASNHFSPGRIIGEMFSWMAVIVMAVAIKLIKNKTELEERNEQLLQEKKKAELNFLKAQMHPHFLFNTLNTLYSETIQNSERAEKVVLHLSNLLRFILEECNKPMITLQKEIRVIKDYVALEQLRHGSRLNISLLVPDTDVELMISPLIFLPFVENSFKHSLNNIPGLVNIHISLTQHDNTLNLTVENDHAPATKVVNAQGSRTGIANVRRQLDLLYDNNYTLKMDDQNNRYHVSLLIPAR